MSTISAPPPAYDPLFGTWQGSEDPPAYAGPLFPNYQQPQNKQADVEALEAQRNPPSHNAVHQNDNHNQCRQHRQHVRHQPSRARGFCACFTLCLLLMIVLGGIAGLFYGCFGVYGESDTMTGKTIE